jgi:hypothetical protein
VLHLLLLAPGEQHDHDCREDEHGNERDEDEREEVRAQRHPQREQAREESRHPPSIREAPER